MYWLEPRSLHSCVWRVAPVNIASYCCWSLNLSNFVTVVTGRLWWPKIATRQSPGLFSHFALGPGLNLVDLSAPEVYWFPKIRFYPSSTCQGTFGHFSPFDMGVGRGVATPAMAGVRFRALRPGSPLAGVLFELEFWVQVSWVAQLSQPLHETRK